MITVLLSLVLCVLLVESIRSHYESSQRSKERVVFAREFESIAESVNTLDSTIGQYKVEVRQLKGEVQALREQCVDLASITSNLHNRSI